MRGKTLSSLELQLAALRDCDSVPGRDESVSDSRLTQAPLGHSPSHALLSLSTQGEGYVSRYICCFSLYETNCCCYFNVVYFIYRALNVNAVFCDKMIVVIVFAMNLIYSVMMRLICTSCGYCMLYILSIN